MAKLAVRSFIFVLLFSMECGALRAQSSLALSSGSVVSGGTISLNLSLNSLSGTSPTALQWTLNYPASSISAFNVTAGAALNGATKTLNCAAGSGAYTCLATGLNANTIPNGVVAQVAVTLSGSTAATRA